MPRPGEKFPLLTLVVSVTAWAEYRVHKDPVTALCVIGLGLFLVAYVVVPWVISKIVGF